MSRASDPDAVRRRTSLKLAEVAWREFDRRRSYEWKVNFAIWPALGVMAGFFWKETPELRPFEALFISTVLAIVAYTYWFKWSVGLWEANDHNHRIARHYLARADGVEDSSFSRENLYQDLLKSRNRSLKQRWEVGRRIFGIWSHGSQITITLILVAIVIFGALRSAKW